MATKFHFYPRPPRGGRLTWEKPMPLDRAISIHALREEGDDNYLLKGVTNHDFYPRPPRGGRLYDEPTEVKSLYFYPRPPRGGRPAYYNRHRGGRQISIHALREEGDQQGRGHFPVRRISIHALREEGDRPPRCAACGRRDFYPRPPRGGRPPGCCIS